MILGVSRELSAPIRDRLVRQRQAGERVCLGLKSLSVLMIGEAVLSKISHRKRGMCHTFRYVFLYELRCVCGIVNR